jgi:hypothetical protein
MRFRQKRPVNLGGSVTGQPRDERRATGGQVAYRSRGLPLHLPCSGVVSH